MAYMHIDNLYKNQSILMFKECYALEKIHGTSAHISYKTGGNVGIFAGGSSHEEFVKLFDADALKSDLGAKGLPPNKSVHIYGEAYGGKLQGMRDTYGDALRFIAFEVKIGDAWLNVPEAEAFALSLGLEFVHYKLIPTTLGRLDAERDADSEQAIRNGLGKGKMREGIVLRPIEEVMLKSGDRVISKHKADHFKETATPRKVSQEELKVLADAQLIANEWVTEERLSHILTSGKVEEDIVNTGKVIVLMQEDIVREAVGEVILSKPAIKLIGRNTALMFKRRLSYCLTAPQEGSV